MIDLTEIKLLEKEQTIFLPSFLISSLVDILSTIDPFIKIKGLPRRQHDKNGEPLPSWDFYINKFNDKESIIKHVHSNFDFLCDFEDNLIASIITKIPESDVIKIASMIENRDTDKIDKDYLKNPNDIDSFVIV